MKTISAAFTENDLKKLRSDTLNLLKAAAKEASYEDVLQIKNATRNFQKFLDTLFYKKMAPLITDKHANQAFRKATWDFYIGLDMPLYQPDEYWNKDRRYAEWAKQKEKWIRSVQRKARLAWKAIEDYFFSADEKDKFDEFEPYTQDIYGFRVIFNSKPTDANYSRLQASLKLVNESLKKVFPAALRRKPIIVFERKKNLDDAGSYDLYERKIVLNLWNFYGSQDPKKGAQIIVHEIAHDIYRNYLSEAATTYWEEAIRNDKQVLKLSQILKMWPDEIGHKSLYDLSKYLTPIDPTNALKLQTLTMYRDVDFSNKKQAEQALAQEDTEYVIPKSPITPYANKNAEESFCEAFSFYTVYGPKAVLPVVRMWLSTVLNSSSNISTSAIVISALRKVVGIWVR